MWWCFRIGDFFLSSTNFKHFSCSVSAESGCFLSHLSLPGWRGWWPEQSKFDGDSGVRDVERITMAGPSPLEKGCCRRDLS